MFTLKPGSCLISSANSFASPLSIAASMIKDQKRKERKEKKRKKKEGRTKGRAGEIS